MAVSKGLKLEASTEGALNAEVSARERAVRERASTLASKRSAPVDPVVDWLEAERLIYSRPSARLCLDGERYRIEIELPGIAAKDLTVRIGDGRLVVQAKRPSPRGIAILDEFGVAEIWRDVTLPPDVLTDAADLVLEAGMLTLTLARRAAPVEAAPLEEAPFSAARVTKRPAKRAPGKKNKADRSAEAP